MRDDEISGFAADPAVERLIRRRQQAARDERAIRRGQGLTGVLVGLAAGIVLTIMLRRWAEVY